MTKYNVTFLLLLILTTSYSQVDKNTFNSPVGKWKVNSIYQAWGEKAKELIPIEDTSIYVFRKNGTYTQATVDLVGKATLSGNWKRVKGNKFYLYNIKHFSEVEGDIPVNNGYQIELKIIDEKQILFISVYDKPIECLTELYYVKTE